MSPSRPFILRPVATSLLMVGILLAGASSPTSNCRFRRCRRSTIRRSRCTTFYPGASPDVMASSVTAPLERQFGQVPGLKQMTSTSSFGSSIITLQFDLEPEHRRRRAGGAGRDQRRRERICRAICRTRRSTARVNPADAPILTLALTSKTLPLSKVEDFADTTLAQKISQLPGVGLVSISGGQKPAVRDSGQSRPRSRRTA